MCGAWTIAASLPLASLGEGGKGDSVFKVDSRTMGRPCRGEHCGSPFCLAYRRTSVILRFSIKKTEESRKRQHSRLRLMFAPNFFVGECYLCPLRRLCRHLSRGERLWSSVVWLFVLIALPCRGRPSFLSHRCPMLLAGALRDRFWGREQVRLAVRRRGVRRLWLLWLLCNMLCLIILFSYIATKSKKTIVFYL